MLGMGLASTRAHTFVSEQLRTIGARNLNHIAKHQTQPFCAQIHIFAIALVDANTSWAGVVKVGATPIHTQRSATKGAYSCAGVSSTHIAGQWMPHGGCSGPTHCRDAFADQVLFICSCPWICTQWVSEILSF